MKVIISIFFILSVTLSISQTKHSDWNNSSSCKPLIFSKSLIQKYFYKSIPSFLSFSRNQIPVFNFSDRTYKYKSTFLKVN
jgi:hypothetical protein